MLCFTFALSCVVLFGSCTLQFNKKKKTLAVFNMLNNGRQQFQVEVGNTRQSDIRKPGHASQTAAKAKEATKTPAGIFIAIKVFTSKISSPHMSKCDYFLC